MTMSFYFLFPLKSRIGRDDAWSCPFRDVVPEGAGGVMAPPDFGKSVNPISTRGTDYSHHITICHTGFSDLPTALSWTEVWSILSKALEAKVCTTSVPEGQCLALGQHQGILRESVGCKCDWFRILLDMFTFLVISLVILYQRSDCEKIFTETSQTNKGQKLGVGGPTSSPCRSTRYLKGPSSELKSIVTYFTLKTAVDSYKLKDH